MCKTLGGTRPSPCKTTAIDQTARIVNLTTVPVHTSGEWIASDQLVCPTGNRNAQRMGAVLAYAHRCALFTLVGIVGEKNLDAPDLVTPQRQHRTA